MKQATKAALAYTAFNVAVLASFAGIAWASPDRELDDFNLAIGIFIGASIHPMSQVIDGCFGGGNRARKPRPSATPEDTE